MPQCQKWRILHCPCLGNLSQSETSHQNLLLLITLIYCIYRDGHVNILNTDMFFCYLTLQSSGCRETACHAKLFTAASNTEGWGTVQYDSEVGLH